MWLPLKLKWYFVFDQSEEGTSWGAFFFVFFIFQRWLTLAKLSKLKLQTNTLKDISFDDHKWETWTQMPSS